MCERRRLERGDLETTHPLAQSLGDFVRRRERLAVAYGPDRSCQFCERTLSAGDRVVYYGSTCDVTASATHHPIQLQRRYCSACGPPELQLPTTAATECLMEFEYAGGGELSDGEIQAVSRRGHGVAWDPTELYDTVIQDVETLSLHAHDGIAPAGLLDVFFTHALTPRVAIRFDGSIVDSQRCQKIQSILATREHGRSGTESQSDPGSRRIRPVR